MTIVKQTGEISSKGMIMAYGRPSKFTKKVLKPLNSELLRAIALYYVGRFAVTEKKLVEYLNRKIRERGWENGAAVPSELVRNLASDMVRIGVVNDTSVATMVVGQAHRKGFGERRARQMLYIKGVGNTDSNQALGEEQDTPMALALRFAEKRGLGPFRREGKQLDSKTMPKIINREVSALVRAGHAISLASRIVKATSVEELLEE